MHGFSTVGSLLVALVSASLAAGTVIPKTKEGTFTIDQVHNTNFAGKSGPIALLRAYNKYHVPIPASLRKAADEAQKARKQSKRATGQATANSDQGDLEYLVSVAIGTPAQNLNLDFDTGSADLWVFSTETQNPGNHVLYNPSDSSTASLEQGESWSITYGDGSSCSGDVYSDSVTVGGLTVTGQAVESAQQVSSQFQSGDSDGLLGLAFSSINTVTPNQAQTWFANVQPQLDSPVFTADLLHDQPGYYLFGAIPSAAQNNINYTPVDNSQGFWGFTATVQGSQVSGIADTGTTLLLLDDSIVQQYYSQIPSAQNDSSQGGYVYNCNDNVPDFTFGVGNGQITISSALMTYSSSGGQCFGGLQSNGGSGLSIFGDIALKAAYVVFDAGNTQLGWAQK